MAERYQYILLAFLIMVAVWYLHKWFVLGEKPDE